MTETITLAGVDFEIRKNRRRKRTSVGIDSCGVFFIACPHFKTAAKLKSELQDQITDIVASLRKKTENTAAPHKYEAGELFLCLGNELSLFWSEEKNIPPLELTSRGFVISPDRKGDEVRTFEAWYKRRLYAELRELLPVWSKKLSVGPRAISIKTSKSLWGSCSPSRNITFSTRLALVPKELLEYVVVHELTHLRHMNHSAQFWLAVESALGDFRERRARLKRDSALFKWW